MGDIHSPQSDVCSLEGDIHSSEGEVSCSKMMSIAQDKEAWSRA
jgi:hypothetical protein